MNAVQDAIMDRNDEVERALKNEDADELFRLSRLFKKEDEEEYAEALYQHAKRFEKAYWAYDESIGN